MMPPPVNVMVELRTYHAHLDVCPQCREHPFEQCIVGARLLREAMLGNTPNLPVRTPKPMMPPRPDPAPLSETELAEMAEEIVRLHGTVDCAGRLTFEEPFCNYAPDGTPLCESCQRLCDDISARLIATVRALQQQNQELEIRVAALDPNHMLRDGSVPK